MIQTRDINTAMALRMLMLEFIKTMPSRTTISTEEGQPIKNWVVDSAWNQLLSLWTTYCLVADMPNTETYDSELSCMYMELCNAFHVNYGTIAAPDGMFRPLAKRTNNKDIFAIWLGQNLDR